MADKKPTYEEFYSKTIKDPHPAFTIEIDVSEWPDWERVDGKARKDDVVMETAAGLSRRVIRKDPSTTTVRYTPGAIDIIMADAEYARLYGDPPSTEPALSFNETVYQHLVRAGMRGHAERQYWTAVRCAELPELEKYLQAVFDLPKETKTK